MYHSGFSCWEAKRHQEVRPSNIESFVDSKMTFSKRSGLDKAVHRIEQALERSHTNAGRLEDEQAALHLQQLLSKTQGILSRSTASNDLMPGVQIQAQSASPHSQGHLSSFSRERMSSSLTGTALSAQNGVDDGYALEDAENPLQLLARASDLPISPRNMPAAPDHISPTAAPNNVGQRIEQGENQDLRMFFGPLYPNLDTGEDIDPIDMGYVTPSETEVLFNLYDYPNSFLRLSLVAKSSKLLSKPIAHSMGT
jgi:hypothetical protein